MTRFICTCTEHLSFSGVGLESSEQQSSDMAVVTGLVVLLWGSVAARSAADCEITPGTLPLDTAGNAVHAHGAGVYQEGPGPGRTLYLIGTSQKFAVLANTRNPSLGMAYLSESLNLYSTNKAANALCRWKFLGSVLNRSTVEAGMRPALASGVTARIERPKLARAANGKYVIWAHVQAGDNSSYSNVAVAVSDVLDGRPFQFRVNFFANGLISKDSTLFSDPRSGHNYFVRDTAHQCDAISPLTSSGLGLGPLW
eukprot:SAG31_NODE_3088_length_4690_cov_2.363973_2_plen_255_part_00